MEVHLLFSLPWPPLSSDGDDLLKPWALLVYETRKCDCAGYLEPGIIVASGNTGTPIRRLLAEVTNLRCLA